MSLVNLLQLRPQSRRQPVHADMHARCPDRYAEPLEAISIAHYRRHRDSSVRPASPASNPHRTIIAVASLQIPIAQHPD
jgi:hypothetical protein